MTCGIYCITNTATGDRYVGASIDVEKRWKTYRRAMRMSIYCVGTSAALVMSYAQYGLDVFKFEILEECSQEQLKEREWDWANLLKPSLNAYEAVVKSQGKVWAKNSKRPDVRNWWNKVST